MHSLFVSSYRAASIPSTRMPLTGGNHSSLCDSAVSAPRHLPLNRARSFRIHQLGPERRVDLPLPRRLISQRALSRTAALSSIHSTHAASIFLRRLSQRALSRLAARFPNRTSSACAASISSDITCQWKSLAMWILWPSVARPLPLHRTRSFRPRPERSVDLLLLDVYLAPRLCGLIRIRPAPRSCGLGSSVDLLLDHWSQRVNLVRPAFVSAVPLASPARARHHSSSCSRNTSLPPPLRRTAGRPIGALASSLLPLSRVPKHHAVGAPPCTSSPVAALFATRTSPCARSSTSRTLSVYTGHADLAT